jgi:hypothetical protein
MKMPRPVSLSIAAVLLGAPAHAQDRTAGIDSIFSFATTATPGCAVGVSRRGEVVANRAYGLADVERRVPMSPGSRFDIGSTQKQFTAAELQALDGRYESRELGTVFEIVPGASGLVMRFERSPERSIELAPVERDTYMRSMMVVRFRRDGSGKVTGFDYGNPVVRSIAFTRLGARTPGAAAAAPAIPASPAPRLEGLAGEYRLAAGRTLAVTLDGRSGT